MQTSSFARNSDWQDAFELTLMSAEKCGWETYVVDTVDDFRRVLDGTARQWRPAQGHTNLEQPPRSGPPYGGLQFIRATYPWEQ